MKNYEKIEIAKKFCSQMGKGLDSYGPFFNAINNNEKYLIIYENIVNQVYFDYRIASYANKTSNIFVYQSVNDITPTGCFVFGTTTDLRPIMYGVDYEKT